MTLSRRSTLALLGLSLPLLATPGVAAANARKDWAQAVEMAGVPNLHRVTDRIYRSAQPTAEGFRNLAQLGIRTVINLRRTRDDSAAAKGTGLELVHIRIATRHITDDNGARIVQTLRSLRDAQARGPVLLHCTHGADRTGAIIALWRLLYQGWSRDEALDEMQNGGFNFNAVWINIPAYLRRVDLDDLRTRIAAAGP